MIDPSVGDWRRIMAAQAHGHEVPTVSSEDPVFPVPKMEYVKAGPLPDHLEFPKAGPDWEDPINLPSHYTHLPVEAIDITEHFNFCMGNALKYIWRADHKGNAIQDLKKAQWYIGREIGRRERA